MKFLAPISVCCFIIFTALAHPLSAQASESAESSESAATPEDISGSVIFERPETFDSRFFTVTLENDLFVGDDDGFTNGIGLTYGRGPFTSFSPGNSPDLLYWATKRTYINTRPDKIRGISYHLAQFIQTPEDITITEPQPDDIPWAGLLSLDTTFYAWDRNASDQLTFTIGALGPVALARESQTTIHRLIGEEIPRGWRNQLDNEVVFGISAVRNQKLYRRYGERYGVDVIALGEGGLGTVLSSVGGGIAFRVGTNMEFSHATFDLAPDRQVNSLSLSPRNDFYAYVGASGTYVFNDILLDGNTFEDSASAPLKNAQNLVTGGVVAKYGKYAYVFQLSSFSTRTDLSSNRESLGALSLTVAF